MSSDKRSIEWDRTTFDGSRREQLRQAQAMTVRQRLEALDQLQALSERLQAMPKQGVTADMNSEAREPQVAYRGMPERNDIVLEGCTPTPLANYLKALGVLRLLSMKYPKIRAYWRKDRFVLRTTLGREDIERFFLNDYVPTPIMAPWNAGSGFYFQERKANEKDPATGRKKKLGVYDQETAATKVVDAMLASKNKRLDGYKLALGQVKRLVKSAGFITSPDSGKQKDDFILSLRARLPDECVQAMDAGLAVGGDKTSYPPMLGTGWNDGNLDFTSNFMQRLLDVLGPSGEGVPVQSGDWLNASIFAECSPNLVKNTIGQFSPGQAGGPNASIGFEADPAINPWDFVLMIEGVLSFAATTARRNADDPFGVLSYPFTVRSVSAGAGSLGESDGVNARGELWMPLWKRPATYTEIHALMAEGRVALGRKPARDALDFVRAVHHMGGYRGIQSFQRFGLLMRSGKAYLATPLSRVETSSEPSSNLLDELDKKQWLDRFRRFASGDNAANRFLALRKQLEDRVFDLSGRQLKPAEAQSLLVLLGGIQSAVSSSQRGREAVRPIPRLSEKWIAAADDGTPAFRIAKALAGLRGVDGEPLPLRAQFFPVQRKTNQWMPPDVDEKVRVFTGQRGRLIETLTTLLERRLWLAERLEMKDKPLDSSSGATLDDLTAFLRDDRMDARIAGLLPGFCLCEIPQDVEKSASNSVAPAAFSLLKLVLTPDRVLRSLGRLDEGGRLPVPVGMVAQLASRHRDERAVEIAWRRLHSSGLAPAFAPESLPQLGGIDPLRAAAALLVPLRYGASATLAQQVLEVLELEIEHQPA
jgi:CRISPR-associated protein Csx17